MPPDRYADFRPRRRFNRAFRVMVLATAAALVGVIAGGVSVFAVVSALMAPTPHDGRINAANGGETTAPGVAVIAATPQPVAPAPAVAPVQAQTAPAAPQNVNQPNSWPDALSRASRPTEPQAQPATQTITPPTAPTAAANESVGVGSKQTNRTADRREDGRKAAPGAENRAAARPLYGYAPQYNEQAKRRGVVTSSRTIEPAPDEDANAPSWQRDWQSRGFFGDRQRADEEFYRSRPDVANRPERIAPRQTDSGRDITAARTARPQRRHGDDADSDRQFDSLIGNDEWVGDWHH